MIDSFEHNLNGSNTDPIGRITNSLSLKEIIENVKIFLQFIKEHKSQRVYMCRILARTVLEYTQVHHLNHMINPNPKNVIVLNFIESPLFLLRTYIGGLKHVGKIVSRLKEFLMFCKDCVDSTGIDITPQQIEMVIDIAQKRFCLIDILAPAAPLVILRLNNANKRYNSMCGIIGEGSGTRGIILMFSLRNGENDPVYIFAHELGHAFHLALTHEPQIMPAKFDELNELLGITKVIPISDKIEVFADVFAMALLNCPELKAHNPFVELEHLISYYDKYIQVLADSRKIT